MFEKFQEAVRNAYIDLKNNNLLDTHREIPSTGDLKKWCQQCLESGLTKGDEVIFQTFFNDGKSDKPLIEIVRNFETDKLRPLRNFIMSDKAMRPDRDYVNLLAVLVDFKPRPYLFNDWIESPGNKKTDNDQKRNDSDNKEDETLTINENPQPEEPTLTAESGIKQKVKDIENTSVLVPPRGDTTSEEESTNPDDQGSIETTNQTADRNNVKVNHLPVPGGNTDTDEVLTAPSKTVKIDEVNKYESVKDRFLGDSTRLDIKNNGKENIIFWNKKTSYAGVGVISIFIIIFLFSWMNKECMCWNGERYIEVDCKDNTRANEIIGLNRNKLDNFQKIMQTDTLNKEDIGRVWYSKIDNEVEFFTYSGHHPIHNRRSLKAATEHIIRTYSGNKGFDEQRR